MKINMVQVTFVVVTLVLSGFVVGHAQVSFSDQQVITNAVDFAFTVYACDLDGDEDMDVLSASRDGKIAWYQNDGTGNFGDQQIITNHSPGFWGEGPDVYACDLNGDGHNDVLSVSPADSLIAWNINDGSGVFGDQQNIDTTANWPASVYACDLDGDDDMDVLSSLDDKIAWYENDGVGNFGDQQVVHSDGAGSFYVCDLDGDNDMDVLSSLEDSIAWYQNDGSGNFSDQQVITTAVEDALSVYASDLDGDGNSDVLSASGAWYDFKICWYANDGGGQFGGQQVITTAVDAPTSIYACDIDRDEDMDVLVLDDRWDMITWFENDGEGSFGGLQTITQAFETLVSLFPCDLDGDGDMDVLAGFDEKVAWYENLLIDTDVENNNRVVHDFRLSQNYPNPFNPTTVISYQLSVNSPVKLKIYDLSGREITTLVNERKPAGGYSVEWNAEGLASGIYYYRLEAGNHIETRKMVVMK